MKKLYAILFIVALVHTGVYGQAKKPTIMVVPANVWCTHCLLYTSAGCSAPLPTVSGRSYNGKNQCQWNVEYANHW